ncbi:MAG: cobalt ECF transporter T component CbiQ [Planctomycetes bacterium]|nr:cobalt ECF transporter T component CbiQ [Planctomycetota bacterium]
MAMLNTVLGDIDALDRLSSRGGIANRIDPRAMLIATALFVLAVVSYPKYEIENLLPFFVYPIIMISLGAVPFGVVARYLLIASPFAVMVGIFNPLLDTREMIVVGSISISSGWISFISILLRFSLSVSGALVLLACTGYVRTCAGLAGLGAPRLLVTQFLLLYRFVFILADEAYRMARAHSLRSRGARNPGVSVFASLAGHLLIRAYDRGLRLHQAMLARGFDGTLRTNRELRWKPVDTLFVVVCASFFAALRFGNVSRTLGELVMETQR